VQRSLEGCDRWGKGRGILYFEASVVQWKDIRPWRPEFGPEGKHFVSGIFLYFWGMQRSCDGRDARSAPYKIMKFMTVYGFTVSQIFVIKTQM
jgi:hypothetical protein